MKKKMSKTKKQILALGMLALGGLSLGSLTFIPYLLRHWSTIQYEIVNFKSEFNQNEKKFTLDFELSDLDAYKLKYQPLEVKLYSDSNGKSMVSEHLAHYDDFSRSWKLDVDASKLTPGSRYYIGIDYKEGKTRFGAKKIVGFSKNVADFINVPAAVKSINFGKIDTGSAAVKVDFSDDIKSLEGKKVALEYYYLPKGQKVAAKDQVVTTYVDLTTVKEGAADFQLNNLLPDADYYVSGVKLISDGQTPRELTSAEQENIQLSEGSFFNTQIINLKVNKMKASDELDLGKFVLLTFDKTTNPQLAKVNNMPVEISYVNRTSKEHEIKVIRTTLVDNVISFHLNRANNHLLPLGSSFEIAQIKIAGANIEFDKGVSNVFYSQNGIIALKSKTSGTTANVETTFASQDDISGLTANVDLSPLAEHKVTGTIVPLENNLYKATFNISGLTNKTVYNINSISLDKLPENTVFAGGEFDYRKFNFEEGVQRSFLTGINDLSVFIKAAPQIETNLVTYSFGFGSQSNYLNSKQLRLAYHLDGDGHTYYSQVATAAGNAVNFKLNEFLAGRKYHLDNIEIIGEPNINVVIDGDQTDRDFYTRAVVSDIQFENISETSAKAKVFIKSDLEQWKKIADKDAGKVTLVYSAGAHNTLVASTDIQFEPSKLVEKDGGFELEFDLTSLNRKTNYYIDNLIFDSPNTTTLFSGANIVSLDKFFTTKFENASALSVNTYNVSQDKATVEIQFNPDTDSFLDGHKFRLVLKKNDQVISSGPGSAQGSTENSEESTKDVYVAEVKSSTIRFDLTGLDAGSKYTVANLVSVGETGQDATQFSNLKFNFADPSVSSQTSFYTSPNITSIETTFPEEQQAKVVVHIESQKPNLDYANGISLAYLNKTTKVLEFATGSFDKAKKEFTFELGKTNPLQKVTDYEIQRIVAEQHEIPFAKTFNDENKKFSTSAQTAQIIAVQQVGHSVNEIKAVLNFSNNDTYLNGETLQVQLNKHTGGQQVATATAIVKNNSAEFDFTSLPDAGVQYSIGQITHTSNNGGRVTKSINFKYDSNANNQKDKLYTLGEIKSIVYNTAKQSDRATVTISFTDAENFFNQNPSTKSQRTAILKYKDDNNNNFSASTQINNGSVTFNLNNLKEFTQYTVESLEISQINGQIKFSTQAEAQKNFYTKVATISLNDVIYTNKTPTESEVTLVFDSGDKKVIDNKQVSVTLERNGQTNTDKEAHANISFNRETNRYEAKLDFNNLTSGVRYDLKTLTISQTKDDPSALATSTINVDTNKITQEHKNSFATTGVVEEIRLDGSPSDRQARIHIQFQGDTTDQVAGFENRSATLVYKNRETNQLVSDTQTIQSNSATFTLSNLAKQQTYDFVSIKLDGITEIQDDSSKSKDDVNKVQEFTTSFANVEIIDIQQKVENDKTVVTVFFNPDIDEVAINKYQAALEYTPQGGGQKRVSKQVDIDNFRAVFDLEDATLKEVSAFDINAVTLSPKSSGARRVTKAAPVVPPTADFSTLLNGALRKKKVFYSAPKITDVQATTTDNTANLTIKVNQPENTYTGNNVDALLVFKSIRTGTTDVKLIKATSTQISGVEKTFNFNLTDLDKFTNYEIEELRLNGNIIKFNDDIRRVHTDRKQFKTKVTNVETPSFVQTVKNKNEVGANILFDPVKDWYLIGNKVSFDANIDGQTKTFEAIVGSDGLAKLDITSDPQGGHFNVEPGKNITFNTISVVDQKGLGLTNLGTLISPATFKNDDTTSAVPSPLTLKSKDLITSVVQKTLGTNNAQIELKLATSDRLNGDLTLNYLNKQDGTVKKVRTSAPLPTANGNVTFTINGQSEIKNLVDYQLQSVQANGETINFDPDVTISDRQFRTLPNTINVKNIITTYNPQTKTAVARVEFDDTASQFLVGKKVSLSYQPLYQSLAAKKSVATMAADGRTEATIKPDGTVEFKLDGSLDPSVGNGDITIANVPGRAPGGSATTNTYSTSPQGNSQLSLVNTHGTLIDGIKYHFTEVRVLDADVTSFNTTLNLVQPTNTIFSTLPISTYAYQVKTTENVSNVDTTIEAFYLTNQPLEANAQTAQKFSISLYNETNKTIVKANAKSFSSSSPSVANLTAAGLSNAQKYFWKITYQVELEKASLYKIVSTSYDGKDVELSRYTDEHSSQSSDNQLKQLFTTPGTKTKVIGIQYDPIPFDDKATIKVQLDDVDSFVSKNNLQLKLSYQQTAGAGMTAGGAAQPIKTIDSSSISPDGIATFNLTNLSRASQYQIEKVELIGHDAINTGQGLEIKTVTKGTQERSDFGFSAATTNQENQTLFATRNQAINSAFVQTNGRNGNGKGTLTIQFGSTGNQIANTTGIVTFVEEQTGSTVEQEILANSSSDFNSDRISFNLINLKKMATYKIKKVSIGGLDYFMLPGHDEFETKPQTAKIVDIQYSDLESVLSTDDKLAATGKIKVIFDGLENYLIGKTLRFNLATSQPGLQRTIEGQVQSTQGSDPYVEITLDQNNFKSTDSTSDSNIVVGKTWRIDSIQVEGAPDLANLQIPVDRGGTRSQRADGKRGLAFLRQFDIPGYFSNITLQNARVNSSSTINLQSVQFSGQVAQFDGKQVVIELNSNPNHQYFATASVTGNRLSFTGLNLDGLPGLTAHHITSIKIDGVSYPISPVTTTTNTAYTNVEHFTVTRFEWDDEHSTKTDTKLKVIFDPKDKWLPGKKVILKYKALIGRDRTEKTLSSFKQTINSGGELEADFNVPVNDNANSSNNSFDFAQHYEFTGVELADFNPSAPEFRGYNQTKVPTAIYAPSLGLQTDSVRFFTAYHEPKIQDTSISNITNVEGKLNTFKATVSIGFTNQDAIAGQTATTWDIKFFKHIRSNAILDEPISTAGFQVVNKHWDANDKKFKFDIFGDLRDLIDNFNAINVAGYDPNRANNFYMEVSYQYFQNPSKNALENVTLTDKTSAGTFLDVAFPKKYVEITKIEGKQTTAYDYGIEIELYDPFHIIGTTNKQPSVIYDELYKTIFNNGNISDGTNGIKWDYFSAARNWLDKNKARLSSIKISDLIKNNNYWQMTEGSTKLNIGLRLATIDKSKQSILDLSRVGIHDDSRTVGTYVTKIPSPLYSDSNFKPKVSIADISTENKIDQIPEISDTDNYVSLFSISYWDKERKQYTTSQTNYKRIWLNISPGANNSLAGKAVILDLDKFSFGNTGVDYELIIPKKDDELQRVFVMPSSGNHLNAFWGTYTNNWAADRSTDGTGPLRLTIESRGFFDDRTVNGFDYKLRSQYKELQSTLDNSTILGPSPFLAPFKNQVETISYFNVEQATQGHPIDNKLTIYNYGDTLNADRKSWMENRAFQYIQNNYQSPFGISGIQYDDETGNLTVTFDWAKDTNQKHKKISAIMQHKAYAAYVDNDGNMYYFGKLDGDGASFDKDLGPERNSIVFSTRQAIYSAAQQPKENSRLFFVGIVVQPYSNENPNNVNVDIHINGDVPTGRWTNHVRRFNVDAHKKVIVVPGVLDFYKSVEVSRTYLVPILTKSVQDSITPITYR